MGIALGILLVLVSLYLINSWNVLGSDEFSTRLRVSDRIGFNLDTNWIDFGKAVPGDTVIKQIAVSNSFSQSVRIRMLLDGNISTVVAPEENDFILEEGETRIVRLIARIPPDTPQESGFEGIVRIIFYRW